MAEQSRSIEGLRKEIDRLDSQIVTLINERAKVVREIGGLKSRADGHIYVPARELEVYEKVCGHNDGPLPDNSLKAIYREIMSASINLERSVRVSYLGPAYTFTHLAAQRKFGSSVECIPAGDIREVFDTVSRGEAEYGVVPIENSTEGGVNPTTDMFIETDLLIYAEVYVRIHHCLAAKCRREEVVRIYSNPQILAQCREWISANFKPAELIETVSSTKAAQIAAAEPGAAAIAGEMAAENYGLDVLARSIQDNPDNTTRFLILSGKPGERTGRDKTSVMFSITDAVGALYGMLEPFREAGINLTRIESRPSKRRAWDYLFFVDLIGHCQDQVVAGALKRLEERCRSLKVLGSYPIAEKVF